MGDSSTPHQNEGWAGENEFGAIQNMLQNMAEQTRKLNEENRKMREEIRVHGDELERAQEAMKLVLDVQRIQEENRKAQEEKERVHRQSHAVGMQKAQKVMEQILKVQEMQEENRRIQEENRESELRRSQELVEEIMETQRIQEDYRKFQEENEMTCDVDFEFGLRREKNVAEQVLNVQRAQSGITKIQSRVKEEHEKKIMDEMAERIMEAAKIRTLENPYLLLEAERNMREGIPPVKYPTGEEIKAFRKAFQYEDGSVHFAVTGASGSGKSSLINAFRGYFYSSWDIEDEDIAKTGIRETDREIRRYCDPIWPWAIWYDIPSTGTFNVPGWQYFNNHGLFILNIIIFVIGDCFTRTEIGFLLSCYRFGIPTFLVRSKADQHINYMYMYDKGSDSKKDESSQKSIANRFKDTQDKYIKFMRKRSESALREAGLPPQKIYIVSRSALQNLNNGSKGPVNIMDEAELMRDLFNMAKERGNISEDESSKNHLEPIYGESL